MGEAQISPDRDDEDECPPIACETPNITGGATGSSSLTQHFNYHPKAVPISFVGELRFGIAFARTRPPVTESVAVSRQRGARATRVLAPTQPVVPAGRFSFLQYELCKRRTSASAVAP
jgi:hypothetical protein